MVWLPLLWEISGNMCITIVCEPGYDVMNFEVNLIFLIKPFFLHGQKSRFIIFKGLSIKQITQIFVEGESPTLNDLYDSTSLIV